MDRALSGLPPQNQRHGFQLQRYRQVPLFQLRVQGFPDGFQVLCMNCQVGRRDNGGVCPHKQRVLNGPLLLQEFNKLRVGWGNTQATESEDYKAALATVMRQVARSADPLNHHEVAR